jgi:hypothetical protein
MSQLSNSMVWGAAAAIAVALVVGRLFFNREARERRRRQRSHGRVVSKVTRPMVSLAVETEPEKKP